MTTFDIEAIQRAIGKLLYSTSQEDIKQVIQEHSELLSEQADAMLGSAIKNFRKQGDERTVQLLISK